MNSNPNASAAAIKPIACVSRMPDVVNAVANPKQPVSKVASASRLAAIRK